jgi:hypothetical protein
MAEAGAGQWHESLFANEEAVMGGSGYLSQIGGRAGEECLGLVVAPLGLQRWMT